MVSYFAVLATAGAVMDARNIISISYHDEAGVKSDTLDVEIMPHMPPPMPGTPVTLVFFSSAGAVLPAGLFHVQSVTRHKNRGLSFHATGVAFKEKHTKKHSKHYSKTKLSSVVKMVAGRMGHGVKFDAPDPKIDSLNQTNESDLHFLDRLAKKYDCLFSIKNDVVYFVSKGGALPMFFVDMESATGGDVTTRQVRFKSCEASYYDQKKAKMKKVKVGKDKPLLKIRSKAKTEALAKIEAKAALRKIMRWAANGTIVTMGQTIYASTKMLLVRTYHGENDGVYFVKACTHRFSRSEGWLTEIQFESYPEI